MAPPVRPPGLRGAPRELRSRATCEIALLSHHHASRVPSSTHNCAFGWVFRAAARTNTGCPRPNSHREVARPGGNITGVATLESELGAKRLEHFKEAFPTVARVAALYDPTTSPTVL